MGTQAGRSKFTAACWPAGWLEQKNTWGELATVTSWSKFGAGLLPGWESKLAGVNLVLVDWLGRHQKQPEQIGDIAAGNQNWPEQMWSWIASRLASLTGYLPGWPKTKRGWRG